jgi:hypothetical protein
LNTYRAVPLDSGQWAIAWSVGGIVHGLTLGTFDTHGEALFHVYELARMELREAGE